MNRSWIVLGVTALALGGCGGGGGGGGTTGAGGSGVTGTCGTVEPCGGDLTGSWTITGQCINSVVLETALQASCSTASVGNVSASASGTVSFNSDSTYSISENVSGVIPWSIPSSCTGGMTCAAFGASVQASLGTGTTFTCTGISPCSCTETISANTVDTGTYSATGNDVAITSATSGTTMSGGYCVQGSMLHLIEVDTTMNMGPMGQATIDKDTTAQKQ